MLAKYLLSDGDSSLVHSPYLELLKSAGGLETDETFSPDEEERNPDQVQGLTNLQHDPHFFSALPLHLTNFKRPVGGLNIFSPLSSAHPRI